ncbi:MAG: hypothetical protein ACI9XB_000991, partial [Gammaproteobacteria bacterium]
MLTQYLSTGQQHYLNNIYNLVINDSARKVRRGGN